MLPMHPRPARSRFVTRFLAYFEHSRRARERARRLRLEVRPFESREAPSDAIQSLHPIGLLADIGIDPLAIVPPAAEPTVAAPPTPAAPPEAIPPVSKAAAAGDRHVGHRAAAPDRAAAHGVPRLRFLPR
jgi:hypothetical protein